MESCNLQLKVVSCRHLKAFNFFQKLSVYAVVSIVSDESQQNQPLQPQKQRTPIDRNGDGNPEWNHEMEFDLKHISFLDCDHVFIDFDLRCDGIIFGDKSIGEVRVPFKHLVDEFDGSVRFASYQVRSADGKPNGVLNFSYKLNDKGKKYPASENENGGFPVPSVEAHYPSPHINNLAPAIHYPYPDIHYVPPPATGIYYQAPAEVYYPVPAPPPPPPPIAQVAYYPPPPLTSMVYPTPPEWNRLGSGYGGYHYQVAVGGQSGTAFTDTWGEYLRDNGENARMLRNGR
ncbi:PREDICTED: protein SRC2-like [Nelumbo nucifera]|uniref:C2 domain-containing protein n=2 Tax=Nelumbo nucifera TaxID=4432 RepID=A0A822YCP5_NELNU|nr:PREDICTED: protein SRC2-like [Nelumbo nucifera]DAD30360.1 TPA_asm: hypothetical protein HUJ06_009211 [Nelumbo nucifera]